MPRSPPASFKCGNIATHTAMNFIAAGLPLKIVALLDVSKTADAMISDGSVTDIKGLKGKQVAYEEGTTSDILLNYALGQNGMTIADIQKVPMPASDAGAALIAGKVPVAVTYEPYLTLAMQQNPKVKMIYSAGENPGLISDVFVVREEFLKEKPGQIVALLKAWDLALADYRKDTAGGRAIISQAVGAKPEELATAFDGVVYYSLAENKTELGGNFTNKVIPEVHAAARTAGILQKDVDLTQAIDSRFVDAATQIARRPRRLFKLGGRIAAARVSVAIAAAVFAVLAARLVRLHRDRPRPAAVPALAGAGDQPARRTVAQRPARRRCSASASTGSPSAF